MASRDLRKICALEKSWSTVKLPNPSVEIPRAISLKSSTDGGGGGLPEHGRLEHSHKQTLKNLWNVIFL